MDGGQRRPKCVSGALSPPNAPSRSAGLESPSDVDQPACDARHTPPPFCPDRGTRACLGVARVASDERKPAGEAGRNHISWVLLADSLAYKIKKPVRLPFLNFTTLAARHRYCDEELRLNRRLAPLCTSMQ